MQSELKKHCVPSSLYTFCFVIAGEDATSTDPSLQEVTQASKCTPDLVCSWY